ncbi:hypothetical protein A3K86_21070 [Photobacterium jeanii]|uniref:Cytochrome C n=1 Tax=Photobacterium jeanii TaxID=858640 RepID=A0A178K2V3_9GAMM|nr:cytochrome c [Photobacterium jeanii]OAN11436.1 hypothetical protein A3K86_21070 [Photobacterium jeanii]PST90956.1 cytochrome C [Photobacterium jeanii]
MKNLAVVLLPAILAFPAQANEVQQRQDAFSAIEKTVKQVTNALEQSEPDWKTVLASSQQLKSHSQSLMTLFPDGSEEGSKAKSSVWSKPEKFNALMAKMDQGFEQALVESQSQQLAGVKAGLKQAESTCKACHRSYRSRW